MKRVMVAVACTAALVAGLSAQSKKNVWSGVYTNAQADRGQDLYKSKCTMCHGPTLNGAIDGGPPLVGAGFMLRWEGMSLNDMVDQIAEMMPAENPNTLKRQEYVDLLTYLFRANKIPAGTTELGANAAALDAVEFHTKP